MQSMAAMPLANRARNSVAPGTKAVGLPGARTDKPLQLPFAMELARPHKSRLEIEFQGHTAVQVYDGVRGWKVRPYLGRSDVEPYSDDELRTASQQDQLDGILIETTGLADPGPVAQTFFVDPEVAARAKIETLRTDPNIFEIWTSFAAAGEVLCDFAPREFDIVSLDDERRIERGLALVRAGKQLIEYITRARVPMPKSTREYIERLQQFHHECTERSSRNQSVA